MVFNCAMDDKSLIKDLGGPTKLAELLGFDKKRGGVQRVGNWVARGIPPAIKVQFPKIFMRKAKRAPTDKAGA